MSDSKVCGKCGLSKPIDEFGFRYPTLGIRHSWCKSCFAVYKRNWYIERRSAHIARASANRARYAAENQRRMWEYLALHPCVDCGSRDIVVLQFDHVRGKWKNVAQMASSGFAWRTIEAEIAKC